MSNVRLQAVDRRAEWNRDQCDAYDYFIAVFSGVAAGLVDVFL